MIKIFCVEGTKGAGKTTTIQNLRNFFETKKLSVVVKAPFYDVRPELKKLTGFENTYPASLDPIAAPLCDDLLIKQITSDINNKKADEIIGFFVSLSYIIILLTHLRVRQRARLRFPARLWIRDCF